MTLPSCRDWAVVYTTKDEAAVKEFVGEMKKCAPSLGLALAAPKSQVRLDDSRPATYVQRLDMVLDAKPQIVMVVIPNDKVSFTGIVPGLSFTLPLPRLVLALPDPCPRVTTTRPSRGRCTSRNRHPASASPPTS